MECSPSGGLTSSWAMRRLAFLCACGAAAACPMPASAFNQPPGNFGATTFLDGGGAPPGMYFVQYMQYIDGKRARDLNGDLIAGDARANALVSVTQLFYLSPVKLAGGYLGLDLAVPVVGPSVRGSLGPAPLTSNTAGLGDIVIGPALQWNDGALLGRPFLQRVETYVVLPTGRYDKTLSANPGSNLWTVEPYYALTWLFTERWEISWRFLYGFHGMNGETLVRPGQLFHMNFAASYAVHPKLRLGAAGYALRQTTEDSVAGASSSGSKEKAWALGPGLVYGTPDFSLMLSYPVDFAVRNRFQGSRFTLQLIHRL